MGGLFRGFPTGAVTGAAQRQEAAVPVSAPSPARSPQRQFKAAVSRGSHPKPSCHSLTIMPSEESVGGSPRPHRIGRLQGVSPAPLSGPRVSSYKMRAPDGQVSCFAAGGPGA